MKHSWTIDELIDNWTLLPNEVELVAKSNKDHNRLGYALLLKYFKIEGAFPYRASDVPKAAIEFVARQLKLKPDCLNQYQFNGRVASRHRGIIRPLLGFREATLEDNQIIIDWLVRHTLPDSLQLESVLQASYQQFRTRKLEPHTRGRMERLARSAIRQFTEQFCQSISDHLTPQVKRRLDSLLERGEVAEGELSFRTSFGELKTDAGVTNLEGVMSELEKLQLIQDIELPEELLKDVPQRVIQQYRRRVAAEPPREVRRHPDPLRYTLMSAFCISRSQEIKDNLIDLFIGVIKRMDDKAKKQVERHMLKELKKVRGKRHILYDVAKVAIERPLGVVNQVIYPIVNEQTLKQIVTEYQLEGSYEDQTQVKTRQSYARHYRRMVPLLLNGLTFRTNNDNHQPLIKAINLIKKYNDSQKQYYADGEDVPLTDVVPASWWRMVIDETGSGKVRINRISYEVCVLQRLRDQLRCKAVWVEGAYRYRNPDEDLPEDFNTRRESYYEMLKQPLDSSTFIAGLKQRMVDGLSKLNDGLPDNSYVEFIPGRKNVIKVSPLEAQDNPLNISHLKHAISERWSLIELLDILKEADFRIGFSKRFHSSGSRTEMVETTLQRRLLMCLYALGTNAGFQRMAHAEKPKDLRYVKRRFINKNSLRAAIADVVNDIFKVRAPHIWGESTTACASDSKKFAAWDQNLLTEWHVRYRGPGIMVYWHVDKKSACIHSQVKGVSSSEVAAMIEGVLHHCTDMEVEKNYVDTHGQSEVAFAFCHLLGIQLLPRLKGIGKQKLSLPFKELQESLPNLEPALASRPIRWHLIEQEYDEMLKFATALRLGTAEAEAILRRFTKKGPQHPTYKALAELGKVIKTIFLCDYLHSIELRREIHEGLNVIENWNSANGFIYYGRSGEISTNNRDEQEISILSMHLLQVCLVYINTLLIQQVLADPEWLDRLQEEDLRALSPLIYGHVNPYGRFFLDMDQRLSIGN
ncbi:MAG: Tn3 family transposase [Chloroflexota bacterium]